MKKKRLTPDEAVAFVTEQFRATEPVITKELIYKYVSYGKLKNHGRKKHALYDQDELIKAFGVPQGA